MTPLMRRALPLTVLLAVSVAAPAAQQKPAPSTQKPPVFRGGVDLVQIDVVVLDADGQPVRGLTKDDFTLFDRLVKQEIATFAAKSHERPAPDPFAAPLPLDVADNRSAKSDRLVIIILDDLHFRGRTVEAVRLVRRAVEELGDSVSLGLVTTSGTFGIEPTEDRARLLLAVENFLDRYDPARAKLPALPGSVKEIRTGPSGGPALANPADLASMFAPLNAYKTVEDVARMAGANDGRRKAFVWITAGPPGPGGTYEQNCAKLGINASAIDWNAMGICGMYEKLFRSSIAVYSVSPGGPADGGGMRAVSAVSAETGGFAIAGNEMDDGMYRLIADLDNYYLLGFYPAEPGPRGYRDIGVVVDRPGYTVRHRIGYHAAGPVPPPKNRTELDNLVTTISPKSELHLRATATPFFTSGSSMQLLTTVEVDIAALPEPAGATGLVRDLLEFAVFAVDLGKKKVTRSVGRRVLLEWPEDHREPGAERFLLQTVLNVPPGAYQLRMSATSKTPEKSGSVYLQLDVPAKSDDRPVALSGILVGSDAESAPRLVESKPLKGLTVPFAPSLDREFSREETLRVFFQVHRKNTKTPVEGTVTLMDPDGLTAASLPWKVEANAANTVSLDLPLTSVAAGPYRLLVSAAGGSDVAATQEVRLRVKPKSF